MSLSAAGNNPEKPVKEFAHPERVRYDGSCMTIDGRDVFIYSAAFHYFRCPEELWRDRFRKIKAAGFNTVETYVPWNRHERSMPSGLDDTTRFDFSEIRRWLEMAQEEFGLYTIVRPGPFICAEYSGGAYPRWLARFRPDDVGGLWLRSADQTHVRWCVHWFDAVCNSFSTIATGGFCTKNASIAAYNSVSIEIIIMFFMMISGLHFGLIFGTLTGKNNNIFRSEISRYYVLSLLIGGCVIAADLWINGYYPNFWTSLRYGLFEMISVSTTTGFATVDTSVWSPLAIILLMLFTIQCACAGSTAGGIKCDRMLLSFKAIKAMMIQRQHPNAIIRVKMNGVIQENHTVNMAVLFIIVYLILVGAGTVIFCAFNIDLETSFSMTISSMANAGSGFGEIGSMDNYHNVPTLAKAINTILMLLGRLEIFGFLQLFLINRWK